MLPPPTWPLPPLFGEALSLLPFKTALPPSLANFKPARRNQVSASTSPRGFKPALLPPPGSSPAPSFLFTNFRDASGRISGSADRRRNFSSRVPRFGTVLDTFLDAWGYDDDYINALANAKKKSSDVYIFSALLSEHNAYTEARWFWRMMDIDDRCPFRWRSM